MVIMQVIVLLMGQREFIETFSKSLMLSDAWALDNWHYAIALASVAIFAVIKSRLLKRRGTEIEDEGVSISENPRV